MTVVYVCTGNVCRSPTAELLLRAWLPPGREVVVHSAGIGALVGQPMDDACAQVLADFAVDPSRHRARQFEPWMAQRADLVLTAERLHRDHVMTLVPMAFRRTFTMKEFARLVPAAGPGSPLERVAHAAEMRAVHGAVPRSQDDIPDPYRQGVPRAREVGAQIEATVQATLEHLGLRARPAAAAGGRPRPSPYRRPRPGAA